MAPTAEQIAATATWLPTVEADPNTWDAAAIEANWTKGIAGTVRKFWFQRVSDTAGYLDLPDPGGTLTITQIYRQAREMLDYWDAFILKWGAAADPGEVGGNTAVSFGRIAKRYRHKGIPGLADMPYYAPYPRA